MAGFCRLAMPRLLMAFESDSFFALELRPPPHPSRTLESSKKVFSFILLTVPFRAYSLMYIDCIIILHVNSFTILLW